MEISMLQQLLEKDDIVSLIFEEKPLLGTENSKEIESLFLNNYVTFKEALELNRKIHGLPELSASEIKKLESERKKKIEASVQPKNIGPQIPKKRESDNSGPKPEKKKKVEAEQPKTSGSEKKEKEK
jgi:hypothetical protein